MSNISATVKNRDMTFEHTVQGDMIQVCATIKGYTMCTHFHKDEAKNKELVEIRIRELTDSLRNLTRWNENG